MVFLMSDDVNGGAMPADAKSTQSISKTNSSPAVEVSLVQDSTPESTSRVPVEVVIQDASDPQMKIEAVQEAPTDVASDSFIDVVVESEEVEASATESSAVVQSEVAEAEVEIAKIEMIEAESDEKAADEAAVEGPDPTEFDMTGETAKDNAVADTNPFEEMGLSPEVLRAIVNTGYESPSPIQVETVPFILEGRDLIGQAETGSGKTAAFAWPILSKIDPKLAKPQVLVLAPTRELAIQVTSAFEKYAAEIDGFRAVTIYGGQSYETQLRALSRGVHVVVGTPGRVMDHLRRETLDLSHLNVMVLDEADEMLRMGFIDDVQWILEQVPTQRQILSFSATMPEPIRRIAKTYLSDPAHVSIKSKTATADTIHQTCLFLHPREKMETLVRLLETEETEGVLVFVKTRNSTNLVAENLIQRGIIASALNGDIPQAQRERTVNQLKSGRINVVVATDVAARGLDVKRISHVVNYDFPHDTEAYVHRIGRTGRAGATGNAILFVEPKEKGKLGRLQRSTNQRIEPFKQKSLAEINDVRIAKFKQRIVDAMEDKQLKFFTKLISDFQNESELPFNEIAGALAILAQGDSPLLLKELVKAKSNWRKDDHKTRRRQTPMVTYRVEVGRNHKVGPGNIVGAVTNEANLNNSDIGKINIFDRFSTIDLPADIPQDIIETLANVHVSGQRLAISKSDRTYAKSGGRKSRPSGGGRFEKGGRYGKKFGGKKFGGKKFGDRTYGDRAGKSHSFRKPGEDDSRAEKPAGGNRGENRSGKRPSRSNASGSVFAERGEFKGKKSFGNKGSKPKSKAAERTKAKRKPGAKHTGPMKKYVKIRSSK